MNRHRRPIPSFGFELDRMNCNLIEWARLPEKYCDSFPPAPLLLLPSNRTSKARTLHHRCHRHARSLRTGYWKSGTGPELTKRSRLAEVGIRILANKTYRSTIKMTNFHSEIKTFRNAVSVKLLC